MTDPVRIIENAALVLSDRIERGWVAVADGRIAEIGEGRAPERGLDLAGDHLLPGLVELHTDHLEGHYAPRPKVRWHPLGAVLAYDAQIAASGITTVFDSLRAGVDVDGGGLGAELVALAELLTRRLAARGRGEDGDLAARLSRLAELGPVRADATIENAGAPEPAAAELADLLRRHAEACGARARDRAEA